MRIWMFSCKRIEVFPKVRQKKTNCEQKHSKKTNENRYGLNTSVKDELDFRGYKTCDTPVHFTPCNKKKKNPVEISFIIDRINFGN